MVNSVRIIHSLFAYLLFEIGQKWYLIAFLGLVYRNLIELVAKFSGGLDFERNDKLGWLTTNLELLGTGIYCKAYLKLQHSENRIKSVAETSGIKVTSIDVMQTGNELENGFNVELSNRKVFGVSEFECVKLFYEGINKFLQMLENGEVQDETVDEPNEMDSKVACEIDSKANEGDVTGETEQPISVENDAPKDGEPKSDTENQNNDENVRGVENTANTENDQNEPLTNTEEVNEENDKGNNEGKPSGDENVPIPSEPNNEDDTDNIAEGEKVNDEKLENNEIDPKDSNQTEMECSAQLENAEEQGEKVAEEQPTEG